MVAYSFAEDFSAFVFTSPNWENTHGKRPHASLLITEMDDRRADPQILARVSIRGTAEILARNDPSYPQVKIIYLERFVP
jgi:hypothetical protein